MKAGRQAGNVGRILAVVEHLDALDHVAQQRRDRLETLHVAIAGLGDLEDLLLGDIEQLLDVATCRIECGAGDFIADGHQLAQHRPLMHDLGIAADIGRRRRRVGDFAQIGKAAGLLDLVGLLDGLEHGDHVGRTGGIDQLADMREDAAVIVAIEIRLADDIGDALPGIVVEQQAAEQRLLCLDGMRRQLERGHLGIRLNEGLCVGLRQGHHVLLTAGSAKRMSLLVEPAAGE